MSSPEHPGDGAPPGPRFAGAASGGATRGLEGPAAASGSAPAGRRTMPPPELADRIAPASVTELLLTASRAES
ncbi:MAG TPA: hypothetical protein VHB21_23435, partial [Minicystis sp.]|nr:hypothetical protein [Minicystis sp.]